MLKKLLIALVLLVAVVAAALFWLSGNMDALVKSAIESYGSDMTQAKVSVGAVNISASNGKGTISNLTVGNPAGFKTTHALKVGQIEVEVDIASLTKDVVLVRRIAILAPDVIYEKDETLTNFDAISQHIASATGASQSKGDKKTGKKLMVELLTVQNAKAQASAAFMNGKTVSVSLPDITLKNIGRAKGGVTAGELGQEITAALKAKLSVAASFERLLKSGSEALDQAGASVKSMFK
jgi:hypothetical protein